MAKRFTDTEIWQKKWFQELSLKGKNLFKFLCDNCDCAGIWETNYNLASFLMGETITESDILELNSSKKQVEFLENGKVFVIDSVSFQQNLSDTNPYLNPNNNVHKGILRRLMKNGIDVSPYLGPSEGQEKASKYMRLEEAKLVNLTEEEYKNLVEKYGEDKILRAIFIFDSWLAKGSKKAKEYIGKSHYAHFRVDSWVWQRVEELSTGIDDWEAWKAKERAKISGHV